MSDNKNIANLEYPQVSQINLNESNCAIESIQAINNIAFSEKGTLIPLNQPIWEESTDKKNKIKSVVFDFSKQRPAQLNIVLASSPDRSKVAVLEGLVNGKLLFSGKIGPSNSVKVESQHFPGNLTYLENIPIEWQLRTGTSLIEPLGATMFDVYWINLFHVTKTIYRKGTPIELIKDLMASNESTALFEPSQIQMQFTVPDYVNMVFNYVPPRYDIWNGRNYFTTINGWNNITLHYTAYLNAHNYNPNSILNCYDAAAVMQYVLRYYNYNSYYCFMQPFGYLRCTNLIGRGNCNNPFYGNGGAAVVNQQDPNRTAFGNHAFVYLTSNQAIVDSCAGPHTGTEYAADYVNNATDNVYPNPPRVRRGTTADIGYYTGVTSVNFIQSIQSSFDTPHLSTLKKVISFQNKIIKENEDQLISGVWEHPQLFQNLKGKWTSIHEEIVPGEDEVLKMHFLQKGEHSFMQKIYISSGGNKLALNRFLSIAALSQNSTFDLENGVEGTGHFSVVKSSKNSHHFIGLYHNAVIEIHTTDNSIDLTEMAKWYIKFAEGNLINRHEIQAKSTKKLHLSGSKREQLKISLKTSKNDYIELLDAEDRARIVSIKDTEIIVDQIKKNIRTLHFLIIDKDTLLVEKETLEIKNN
mgnify:CR=1 FL=1